MELINVLLVEDNIADVRYVEELVREDSYCKVEVKNAKTVMEAIDALDKYFFNVILLDLSLPDSDGIDTIDKMLEHSVDVPIVVLTGSDDENTGILAVKKGAQDFLTKNNLNQSSLCRTIKHSIERNKIVIKQKELDELKNEFINLVSHEVRTPLTGIKGMIDLIKIKKMLPDGKLNEYFNTIEREVLRLIEIVNDLLDIQKISKNTYGVTIEKVNVNQLIEESILVFSNSKNPIVLECEESIEYIYADFDKIKQVLLNLISNAIKFSRYEGEILIKITEEENKVKISIVDNGIGISKDDMPNLFNEFYRVNGENSLKTIGTGLGLSLCKKILELHGSKIKVESELGEGSEFSFSLENINT